MRKTLSHLVLMLAFPLATSGFGQEAKPAPLKVLFIGNSYTFFNDLPSMVVALAEAGEDREIEVDRRLVGGCTFERHVKETGALDKIRERKWDVVVLQEQSLRPVVDRAKMHEYAAILHAEATRQGAETVFYLTWARQHIPDMQEGAATRDFADAMFRVSRAVKQTSFDKWYGQHKADLEGGLNGAYFDIAEQLKARVAPVGIAWRRALMADPPFVLHKPDRSHPNPTGSYLAACVFYSTLLRRSPVGLPGELAHDGTVLVSIPQNEAKRLQRIAWESVGSVD